MAPALSRRCVDHGLYRSLRLEYPEAQRRYPRRRVVRGHRRLLCNGGRQASQESAPSRLTEWQKTFTGSDREQICEGKPAVSDPKTFTDPRREPGETEPSTDRRSFKSYESNHLANRLARRRHRLRLRRGGS